MTSPATKLGSCSQSRISVCSLPPRFSSLIEMDFAGPGKGEMTPMCNTGIYPGSIYTEGDGNHVLSQVKAPLEDRLEQLKSLPEEDAVKTGASQLQNPFFHISSSLNQSYLKSIFDNFNELYNNKMAWIEENIPDSEAIAHITAKKNVLEHWVKDVIEQNSILVQTVEELEAEAEAKVTCLQKKTQELSLLLEEKVETLQNSQKKVNELMNAKELVDKQEEFYRKEAQYLEKEKKRALERLNVLETDNTSLTTLISRVRDMGVWDITGLSFSNRTYDFLFGLHPNLAGSEVQTAFTVDRAKKLEKAEANIVQLTTKIEELEREKHEKQKVLLERTQASEEMQKDIADLQDQIQQYEKEHAEFKKRLRDTQEKLDAANQQIIQSRPSPETVRKDSEMKEMLQELRDLKNQLTIAHNDRQLALQESNIVKAELRGRISQMEEMKSKLEQIQTEQISTRTAVEGVQERQDELSLLKEQVSFYQTSYQNSSVLLEAKTEVIAKLQTQMEQLHEKVVKLEKSRPNSPKPFAACKFPHARGRKVGDIKHVDQGKKRSFSHHKPAWSEAIRPKKPNSMALSEKAASGEVKKHTLDSNVPARPLNFRSPVGSARSHGEPFVPTSIVSDDPFRQKEVTAAQTGGTGANRSTVDYLLASDKMSSDVLPQAQAGKSNHAIKFPPIPTTKSGSSSPTTRTQPGEKSKESHLPRIVDGDSEKRAPNKSSKQATLENLMEICVKASRELNLSVDNDTLNSPKFSVITGHTHRRRSLHSENKQENTLTVKASPTISTTPRMVVKTSFKDSEEKGGGSNAKTKAKLQKSYSLSDSESLSDISKFRRIVHFPVQKHFDTTPDDLNPEKILSELPKEPHDQLVKRWILNSPSPSKRGRGEPEKERKITMKPSKFNIKSIRSCSKN